MKEIIIIIRPKKVEPAKDALEKLGFPSLTALAVIGRGRQRGIASELNYDVPLELLSKEPSGRMKYIPKRMLSLVVDDKDVDPIVHEIIKIDQTAQIGDGKIFICPVENAVRVRTDESGIPAL